MASLRQNLEDHPFAKSALAFAVVHGTESLRRAMWTRRLRRIQSHFAGDTGEVEEDRALALLLGAESADELLFLLRGIGPGGSVGAFAYGSIFDELDENDIDAIYARLAALLDRRDYLVGHLLERFFEDATRLPDQEAAVRAQCQALFGSFSATRRRQLVDELLDRRRDILEGIELMAHRDHSTHARELRVLLAEILALTPHRSAELTQLSWEVLYTDRVARQLQATEFAQLLDTLPDLVDPTLSALQRSALFDTLHRAERIFRALQEVVTIAGSLRQQTDMRQFMRALDVFLDNFTPDPPTPGLIAQIAAFFGAVTDEIAALRAALLDIANELIGALNLPSIFDTDGDDKAQSVAGGLATQDPDTAGVSLLSLVPFDLKKLMINLLLEGSTEDDDEQAILQILQHTKTRSVAEFAQLASAVRFEDLDFSIDGSEHDQLMALMEV